MTTRYICYEEGFEGVYTLEQMQELYKEIIDKSEYIDFSDWLVDMLKSGIFTEVK